MTRCRCCRKVGEGDEINDTYGTCFVCWEIYKTMTKILAEDKPRRGPKLVTAEDFVRQYNLFDQDAE